MSESNGEIHLVIFGMETDLMSEHAQCNKRFGIDLPRRKVELS